MDSWEIQICPRCQGNIGDDNRCDSCRFSPSEGQDCPHCGCADLYDAAVGYCYNCAYNGMEALYEPTLKNDGEGLLPAADLVEDYERN